MLQDPPGIKRRPPYRQSDKHPTEPMRPAKTYPRIIIKYTSDKSMHTVLSQAMQNTEINFAAAI